MAALTEGQYGLSAQDKINSNKTFVFVKLTDSALKSIEDYIRNSKATTLKPKIKFQGNNGTIFFPNNSYEFDKSYDFSLSNEEADGPQGSFECLQQSGNRYLQSMGCMHMKMHINANDDVYEKTRVKMAAVEQENKKSWTKEIKPSGPHLGRKVKVRRPPGLTLSPIKSSSPMPYVPQKPPPKFANATLLGSSVSNNTPSIKLGLQKASPAAPQNKQRNAELLRQPIRDRVIHLLAIRPYKKPELIARLRCDGMKEKDKKSSVIISAILNQITDPKKSKNSYYLANHVWSEVQDNWKFCTAEEREIILENKQKHMNGNNESHTLPSISNNSVLQKRVVSQISGSGTDPISKKQRISHCNRNENASLPAKTESSNCNGSDSRSQTLATSSFIKRNASPLGSGHSDYTSQRHCTLNGHKPASKLEPPSTVLKTSAKANSENSQFNAFVKQEPPEIPSTLEVEKSNPCPERFPKTYAHNATGKAAKQSHTRPPGAYLCDNNITASPKSNSYYQGNEPKFDHPPKPLNNGYVNNSITNGHSALSYRQKAKVSSTTNGSCSTSPHSSSDSRDSIDYNGPEFQVTPHRASPMQFEYADYTKLYNVIKSSEQRTRYKADFNAQYEEYLKLHDKIKSISKTFASLEEKLNMSEEGSEEYVRIKGIIYNKYRGFQHDPKYLDDMKKFHLLHSKLSHIKKLVTDFDSTQCVKS